MPRPLCFLTSLFEQEFYITDPSEEAGEKGGKHAWSSHIPSSAQFASWSVSVYPTCVLLLYGASHIGYGKVRVDSSVIRWISQPSCAKISTFLGMA